MSLSLGHALPMIEFGTLTFAAPFQGATLAAESEALGFDYQLFGVNECQTTDVFTELRMAAEATSRIRLGCGVANFVTRHPCVVASAIAAIQVASGGRAICAVGKGDSALGRIGLRPQRHADFSRDLGILRAYLLQQPATVNGIESRIGWLENAGYTNVPIEVAATGPKTLAVAGALADRVSLAVGAAPSRIDWALEIIRSSAAAAGRDPSEVTIGAHLPIWISDSRREAIDELRPHVVGWAHMASFDPRHVATHDPILHKVTSTVHDVYDYDHHGVEESRNSPMSHLADDEFVDYYGIAGPVDYVVERVGALLEKGLEFVNVVGLGEQKVRFAKEVAPALRTLG